MAGTIPEDIINDIQDRCDIVEVISGYIPLKKTGRSFKAHCPFHHEKTPSFIVSPDKQIYHCFGCGVGGNVFNFLMRYEKIEFPEAVENLAKRVGVVLPKKEFKSFEKESLNQKLYKINELAGNFYHQFLFSSKEATAARDYLAERKVDVETAKRFKLGFAPDSWDSLLKFLRSKSVSLDLIEKAGLSVIRENKSGYYDRFRNRIIFPIFDIKSRIIAFGARVLGDSLPKYINSPETSIYSKGRNIFGLNFAKEVIRKNDFVIIVEGYLDFIIPYQEGIDNVVASSGTALTVEQIRLLKRYSRNAAMVFDADQAGQLATLRSLDLFIEEDMNVKVVDLPEGYDPDSFVRKNGAKYFKEKIKEAKNLFDYKLNLLSYQYDSKKIEGKANIAKEMLPTIKRFKNAVLKSSYLKKLAEYLSVKEESLVIELNKLKDENVYSNKLPQISISRLRPTEKMILSLILEEKDLINKAKDTLELDDFQDGRIRQIIALIFDLISQGKEINPNRLINLSEDETLTELIAGLSMPEELQNIDREKTFQDCIRRLKHDRLKLRCQQLYNQIKIAEGSGDKERVSELMGQYNLLIKKEG